MRRIAPVVVAAMLASDACLSPRSEEFPQPAVDRARIVAAQVDGEKLKAHVAGVVAARGKETPIVSPYNAQLPHTHLTSATYMLDAFTALGYVPVADKSSANQMELTNVYVDIPGTRPELVLVTGHHDAWFQSGADDNASALAVLLETARLLKDQKPSRSIRIIAFDGEEEGSIGVQRYLAARPGDNVAIVVNMDCVGYASHEKGSQDAPPGLALRDTGDFLAAIVNEPARGAASQVVRLSNALPRPVEVLALMTPGDGRTPATGSFLRSDHAPFWYAGVPAIFLTDTANFRNHNYHTADDTADRLDYDFLARVAALTVGAVSAFAEAD